MLLLLRDSPCRYGFRLGDVRAGLVLGVTGCLLMTPIVVLVAQLADFHAYYLPAAQASPLDVVLTAAIEVIPAEFFFRGLPMFALIRVVGPIGILLATLPFAFGPPRQARARDAEHGHRRARLRLAGLAHRLGAWSGSPTSTSCRSRSS